MVVADRGLGFGGMTPLVARVKRGQLDRRLSADGLEIVAFHYDRAIFPATPYQCYGGGRTDQPRRRSVAHDDLLGQPRAHSTTLYRSGNGLDWQLDGIVLDHQNKDMLIFEGKIGGNYWAQTRPLGDLYFAYPPASEWRAGPSINLATSPDVLH